MAKNATPPSPYRTSLPAIHVSPNTRANDRVIVIV
nr:MAG TPA: hypothetical protein [Caudoviricetes sp.]